jgi:MYXO-CTERM domain-containing protein
VRSAEAVCAFGYSGPAQITPKNVPDCVSATLVGISDHCNDRLPAAEVSNGCAETIWLTTTWDGETISVAPGANAAVAPAADRFSYELLPEYWVGLTLGEDPSRWGTGESDAAGEDDGDATPAGEESGIALHYDHLGACCRDDGFDTGGPGDDDDAGVDASAPEDASQPTDTPEAVDADAAGPVNGNVAVAAGGGRSSGCRSGSGSPAPRGAAALLLGLAALLVTRRGRRTC